MKPARSSVAFVTCECPSFLFFQPLVHVARRQRRVKDLGHAAKKLLYHAWNAPITGRPAVVDDPQLEFHWRAIPPLGLGSCSLKEVGARASTAATRVSESGSASGTMTT